MVTERGREGGGGRGEGEGEEERTNECNLKNFVATDIYQDCISKFKSTKPLDFSLPNCLFLVIVLINGISILLFMSFKNNYS